MRARKLAEASALVSELLLAASSSVSAALAAPDANHLQLQHQLGQVCFVLVSWDASSCLCLP